MPRMTIDGITCHTEDFSETGRAAVASLEFLDRRVLQIRQEMQIYQTAQAAYARALALQIASGYKMPASPPVDASSVARE